MENYARGCRKGAVCVTWDVSLYVLLLIGASACCAEVPVRRLPSPDETVVAVMYATNCGALADPGVVVKLERAGHEPVKVVSVLDTNPDSEYFDEAVLGVTVSWDGSRLVVSYDPDDITSEWPEHVDGVAIERRPVVRSHRYQ